jgi:hypothetical protein
MGIMPFAMLLNQTVRQCRACGVEFSTPSGNAQRCAKCREQRKRDRYSAGRVPVMSGPRCLEWAGPERVRQLLMAPIARPSGAAGNTGLWWKFRCLNSAMTPAFTRATGIRSN